MSTATSVEHEPIRAPEHGAGNSHSWQAKSSRRVTVTHTPGKDYPWVARLDPKGEHIVLLRGAAKFIPDFPRDTALLLMLRKTERAVTHHRRKRLRTEYDKQHGPIHYSRCRARIRPMRIRPGHANDPQVVDDPDVIAHANPELMSRIVMVWRGEWPACVKPWKSK